MSFDFFLANLLFGIILLTAAMSVAHFVGDFLADRAPVGPNVRRVLRVTTLVSCVLIAMVMFVVKLSGPDLNKAFAPGAGGFEPRLSKFQSVDESLMRASAATDKRSLGGNESSLWTLQEVRSQELVAEVRRQKEILQKSGKWVSLVGAQGATECRMWINRFRQLGLSIDESSSLPKHADAKVFICVADKQSESAWQDFRRFAADGGAIFFLGRIQNQEATTFNQLLQVRSWRTPDLSSGAAFRFGGPLVTAGGFASGLKISLGKEWSQGHGQAVVAADGVNNLMSDMFGTTETFSSYIVRAFAKGRVAWTSLPAEWSEKNKILAGDSWDSLVLRTLSYLGRVPFLAASSFPSDAKSVVIPAIHAEYEFQNIDRLQRTLLKLDLPASFYIVMSEALNNVSSLQRLKQQEIGASSFSHVSLLDADFYDRVMQWQRWQSAFVGISTLNSGSGLSRVGVLASSGRDQPAETLAALMANRFSYVLGDPFNDSFVPRKYVLKRTEVARAEVLGDSKSLSQVQNEILVLPNGSGDDFEFYQDGRLSSSGEIDQSLRQKQAMSLWTGAPFVFLMHTQVLGQADGIARVESILSEAKNSGAQFMSAQSYLEWWRGKSSLETQVVSIRGDLIEFKVTNVGTDPAKRVDLINSESGTWSFALSASAGADAKIQIVKDHVSIANLQPGEAVTFLIKKRSL